MNPNQFMHQNEILDGLGYIAGGLLQNTFRDHPKSDSDA